MRSLIVVLVTGIVSCLACAQPRRGQPEKNYIMPTDSTLTPNNYVAKCCKM
ncbi:hypothetical protein ACI6Q2_18340 [Chitinophagaceae bacterium LWZ2-11]